MGSCIKALVNEVLCEETVVLIHHNRDVAIGDIAIPPGSELSGETTVHNLDCIPVLREGLFGVLITLFVQEELILTTPQGDSLPLEFGFRFRKFCPLTECCKVRCITTRVDELDCRIYLLGGANYLNLNCNGTFEQCLRVKAHVKILQERELPITLCSCCGHIKEKGEGVKHDDGSAHGGPARIDWIGAAGPAYGRGLFLGKTATQTRHPKRGWGPFPF